MLGTADEGGTTAGRTSGPQTSLMKRTHTESPVLHGDRQTDQSHRVSISGGGGDCQQDTALRYLVLCCRSSPSLRAAAAEGKASGTPRDKSAPAVSTRSPAVTHSAHCPVEGRPLRRRRSLNTVWAKQNPLERLQTVNKISVARSHGSRPPETDALDELHQQQQQQIT